MEFIRPFTEARFAPTAFNGSRNYFGAYLESVTVIGSKIVPGGCGPGLHYHPSDQLYFLVEGATNVQFCHDVHPVGAGTLVFVPAGTAHCNWNDSDAEEFHIELIVPTSSISSTSCWMRSCRSRWASTGRWPPVTIWWCCPPVSSTANGTKAPWWNDIWPSSPRPPKQAGRGTAGSRCKQPGKRSDGGF